jgi:ATP-dependent RNA helicase DBP3
LPIALSGRDLVGIAATGSGKTLAFGLPALHHVSAQLSGGVASGKKPVVLVLAPTRELALQITGVLEEAGSRVGIKTVCVYGGVPKTQQAAALRAGVGIVVATPGRLEDLVESGLCELDEVSYFVLDEADRMLDLGFEPHIRKIAQSIRADRQTLMFSATWPSVIRKLAADFMARPAKVTVGSQDLAASHSVSQVVEVVEAASRDARLDELLKKYHKSRSNRLIIFVLYKKEASRVESMLQRNGWNAAAVHGDISQGQRTAAVEAFKSGTVPLLVATDVAARGLDIPDVEVVINYSFPLTTEDYVHRIGRTGRAGKKGLAHTFFVGANDKPRAGELINVLREAGQTVPESLLAFGTAVKKKESKLYGSHFKDIDLNVKAKKVTFDSDSE